MGLRIAVIGVSYLGAVHAVGLATWGHQVIGLDIDQAKVDSLNKGRAPIAEPGLELALRRQLDSGRLRFTTDYADITDFADVHFIAVGTPAAADGSADLSQVQAVVDRLAPALRRSCLIVGKSTVPVGSAAELQRRVTQLAPVGAMAEVAWNPEFLREGQALADTLAPDRLVWGVASETASARLRQVYARPIADGVPVIETDLATAEIVKVAANAFLATKISFINALSQLCQATGADVVKVANALGRDPRIGRAFLDAGPGFGGGCLPKDIAALAKRADQLGAPRLAELVRSVQAINQSQRDWIGQLALVCLGGSAPGKKVAVLGASFKPGTDDTRDSPALAVATSLAESGAEVRVYDPAARVDRSGLTQTDTLEQALLDADLVCHLTDWPVFAQLDPARLTGPRNKILLDARLKLDRPTWEEAGWTVIQPGRPWPTGPGR
ncbi:MAG: UDP-glucose/GDP-mannose dehydrogenase family protein [Propionibacteriaceae bacterium]|jgi:UDPglucose 6-dehydrogenase|nr:UDP-glucose/GDP-mannose dehydrogenase family protein [Propionibacteriaceae bacterium]